MKDEDNEYARGSAISIGAKIRQMLEEKWDIIAAAGAQNEGGTASVGIKVKLSTMDLHAPHIVEMSIPRQKPHKDRQTVMPSDPDTLDAIEAEMERSLADPGEQPP